MTEDVNTSLAAPLSSTLPPLYAAWMDQVLAGPIPEETQATCDNCAMCAKAGDPPASSTLFFHPQVKCCTYLPRLPNFLVGRLLADDGAAALLIVSAPYARAHGLKPMARIGSVGVAGVPPRVMGIGPVPATTKALSRGGIILAEVGLIELNEAFAAQALAVLYEWGMDPEDERLNPNGGAIALGHPLGCSGARILTTLLHEMERHGDVELGLATMCIGVGQGIALLVEKV